MHPRYVKSLQRSDLSQHLVHLIPPASTWPAGYPKDATATLHSISSGNWIIPTIDKHVTRYCPEGVACFYDAPPNVWPEIVLANPNDRLPLGLIVCKRTMWLLGGRPAIYTDNSKPDIWPESEQFRVIHADLSRDGHPIDWMHEREWRVVPESIYHAVVVASCAQRSMERLSIRHLRKPAKHLSDESGENRGTSGVIKKCFENVRLLVHARQSLKLHRWRTETN